MDNRVLDVINLNVWYTEPVVFRKRAKRHIVRGVSFSVGRGEVLGLVGESGCGKSTLAKALLGIEKNTSGDIIHHTPRPRMVFQDPYGSLNPSKTVGWILEEPLRVFGKYTKPERKKRVADMLERVGLERDFASRMPRELSGGQRQRVGIAASLMGRPRLVVADEPVSALDVTIQAQILELLIELRQRLGLSYLFISHDLAVISRICDRVMVMCDGEIVEQAVTAELFKNPRHDYSKKLLESAKYAAY